MRHDGHHHKYWAEEQRGRRALDDAVCPYNLWEIGKRCAWLAGYHDSRPGAHK